MKTLNSPARDFTASISADWLELSALITGAAQSIYSLTQSFDIDQENDARVDPDNDASEETFRAEFANEAFSELERREKALGTRYPFDLNKKREVLSLKGADGEEQYIYLCCLLISAARFTNDFGDIGIDDSDHQLGDLFQICASISAAGFVRGNARSFGWPRADDQPFLAALASFARDFGEGTPHGSIAAAAPGASESPKDAGIDVMAWKNSIDGNAGKLFLLGQSASGKNWKSKSVKECINNFYHFWFNHQPVSEPIPAMFIPFFVDEHSRPNKHHNFHKWRHRNVEGRTKELGLIFDRLRLSFYASETFSLIKDGQINVDAVGRFGDRVRVIEWVRHKIAIARDSA